MSLEFRCADCSLTFTSNVILTDHLKGKRHKKRLETLKLSSKNTVLSNNYFECTICGVIVNSLIQFQAHLKGSKHTSKCETTSEEDILSIAKIVAPGPGILDKTEQVTVTASAEPIKVEAVKKPKETFACESCHIVTNSKTQYDTHVMSQKHKTKLYGSIVKKKNIMRNNFKKNFVSAGVITITGHPQSRPYGNEHYYHNYLEHNGNRANVSNFAHISEKLPRPKCSYEYQKPIHELSGPMNDYHSYSYAKTPNSMCAPFEQSYFCFTDEPEFDYNRKTHLEHYNY